MASGYYAGTDRHHGHGGRIFQSSEALHTIDEQMKRQGKDVAVEEPIKIEDENEHVSYLFMQELYGKRSGLPVWGSRGHEKMETFRKVH